MGSTVTIDPCVPIILCAPLMYPELIVERDTPDMRKPFSFPRVQKRGRAALTVLPVFAEMPSTSNGECSKTEPSTPSSSSSSSSSSAPRTCKNSEIEK